MEKIEPKKYVEIVYDLYKINPDGTETLMHHGVESDPEVLVYGVLQGLVDPLEKELAGKVEGDKFDVVATPEQSFGERDEDSVVELEKDIFNTADGEFDEEMVHVGNVLPMMTADGMRLMGTVIEVGLSTVKMDFNHPLAGSPVRFKGYVKTVREATDEEIRQASGSCCGGCGCDGGGCGSGCEGGGCEGGGCR